MESNFKLEFELIQHTPLIHFQHNQSGATLRASEVKPKLDRFLINMLGGFGEAFENHKLWFVGADSESEKEKIKPALKYKMRIFAHGEPKKSETIKCELALKAAQDKNVKKQIKKDYNGRLIHPLYFGNMVSKNSDNVEIEETFKETVFYEAPIKIEIICFIEDLRNFLQENIKSFFCLYNFGTRQSKGFGQFTVVGTTKEDLKQAIAKQKYHAIFIEFDPNRNNTFDLRANIAQTIYNFMKTGMNYTSFNPKAFIKGYSRKEYIDNKIGNNTGSDKAFMKSEVFNLSGGPNYANYVFIRALLGLADHYEFRHIGNGTQTVYIANYDGTEIRDGKLHIPSSSIKEKKGINRFASPVTIKIYSDYIVFIFNDSWKKMLGKTFLMSRNKFDKFTSADIPMTKYITTPKSFDLAGFIDGFIAYFKNNRYVLDNFPSQQRAAKSIKMERWGD